MEKLVVVPHDPAWSIEFAFESKRVHKALGENVIKIHHIGSTSIIGIHAKPVIDMLVEVTNIDKVDERSCEMEALGYEVMGEFGIEGRRYFRKDDPLGVRTHQIHVFETGSDQIKRHLAFRDFLIAHPMRAKEYSDLKRRLAAAHSHSPEDYMDGKDGFIKEIDRLAKQWLTYATPAADRS